MDPQRPQPEERGLLLLVSGAAVIAVLAALGWWWLGRPQPMDLDPALDSTSPATTAPVAASGSPASPAPSGSTSAAMLVVDIRGAVQAPGLRHLPPGSRVADAIDAAGGLESGHGYGAVNLARPLVDGEQIVVGRTGPLSQGGAPSGVTSDPSAPGVAPVDLNSATADQLETLDGIGPVLASDIIRWRTDNGPFSSVEDLLDVPGIGEATLAGLREQVVVL